LKPVNYLSILERTASYLTLKSNRPSASEVVEALLTAEQITRKEKLQYSLEQLQGTWRLCFITGTTRVRRKTGSFWGSGRYIPEFIEIELTYTHSSESEIEPRSIVKNCVKIGSLKLTLTGPIQLLAPKNILLFDFTYLEANFLGIKLYDGYIRGGKEKADKFDTEKIARQAFFVYFLVIEKAIAARGKGGGLALWSKTDAD
jgi:hypothetical protein